MSEELIVEIKDLVKCYSSSRKIAVNSLNLNIMQGDRFGLLGPNGTGKTTTIKAVCGLIRYNSGSIRIFGSLVPRHMSKVKPLFGYVPQDLALYPTLTGFENLLVFGALYGIDGKTLKSKMNKLLENYGLYEHRNKLVGHYSGGMRRRLNLIVGIMHDPRFLILDEPTTGIDIQSKKIILDGLLDLNRGGTTLLYTSHDLGEAQQLCSRFAVLDDGQKIFEGSLDDAKSVNSLEDLYLSLTGREVRD
ncbi:MAG: ABC transporter ATP-binding protein [Holophagaceae bacterium]|nr:ABC transporter ATP-binding protein [Holophagaceae bacterium]